MHLRPGPIGPGKKGPSGLKSCQGLHLASFGETTGHNNNDSKNMQK